MGVRIRPMLSQDVETVMPLEKELFAGDPPWAADQFHSELAHVPATRWYVVAEDAAEVVGYAGLLVSADTADVQTLAVSPDRQRQGLGSALLAALVEEAQRRAVHEVLLEVRADNAPALRLYARHGFEQIARRRGYYRAGRTDGLVLRRRLSPPGR
jgi:[ribosomal protein S18]-alanine N-acetyltransferase